MLVPPPPALKPLWAIFPPPFLRHFSHDLYGFGVNVSVCSHYDRALSGDRVSSNNELVAISSLKSALSSYVTSFDREKQTALRSGLLNSSACVFFCFSSSFPPLFCLWAGFGYLAYNSPRHVPPDDTARSNTISNIMALHQSTLLVLFKALQDLDDLWMSLIGEGPARVSMVVAEMNKLAFL